MADLKETYGSTYTALQYHIWAELIDSELANVSEPPQSSMFSRVGHGNTSSSTQKSQKLQRLFLKLPSEFPPPST